MTIAGTHDPGGEPLEIVDADGRPLGVKPRAAVHRDGDWHVTFHCWIAGAGPGASGGHLLLQRRASDKDVNPGRLDVSVAGHLTVGETARDGLRELEEEVGLTGVAFEDLVWLGRTREETSTPSLLDRELCETFLLRHDRPLAGYRPSPEEVAAVLTLPLAEGRALFAEEREEVRCRALGHERGIESQAVRTADFVARPATYYLDVLERASALIRGEPVRPLH